MSEQDQLSQLLRESEQVEACTIEDSPFVDLLIARFEEGGEV